MESIKPPNGTSVLPPINSASAQTGDKKLNNVLVITKNDLDRIANHLNRKQHEDEERAAEQLRKRDLHDKSKALTSSWNNTIEGSRRHKLEQRKIREEKLEDMRRQVDLEHAEYMAEERRKAIEKAKLLQYHETDRIKTFHSALKLTEVLKEREAQLELKKLLEQLNREQESEMAHKNEKLLLQKDKTDDESYRKKLDETRALYEFNKKQIQLNVEKMKELREEKAREAEALEEENERIRQEDEQLEAIEREKSKQLKSTYDKMLENRQKMREAEAFMDEEENEEIRVYAAAKKKMAQIKHERELQAQKKKEDHRDRMLGYLGSLLKQQVEDEDFRIAKDVAKNEAKRQQEEQFKEKQFQQAMAEIHQHRIDTLKRQEREKERQEKEDAELMKQKMEADLMYHMYEIEKSKQRGDKSKQFAKNNLKMAKDRRDVEDRMKNADREFVLKDLELLDLEDKQFEEYASRVIAYMEEKQRNTYPMKKVLNETVKPKQPTENKTEAAKIRKHQTDVPTKKNLGFM